MADKTFKLEIVTPRKVVYSGDVVSFSAPGEVGSFQVLYNHAPLLSAIVVGEVKIQEIGGNVARYATSGGFVEVLSNRVVLLAETAESLEEIDVRRAEEAKKRAEQRLQEPKEDLDIERARLALARAINRLRLARPK
ncbi:MAG: F0F1 ATP synthase subunit epsilon [Bacteroidota bacterium]|jgi:F-type H+-transporting ATPase subunit epsilon